MTTRSLQLFAASLLLISALPAQEAEKTSPVDSITIAELRDHMYFLASDYLAGRVAGQPGYRIAAEYGLSQMRAAGLVPMVENADGKTVFLQDVPLRSRRRSRRPASKTPTVEARSKENLSWNVVGLVRGTDPALAKEYITVGAHLDHVRGRSGAVCNGADDNASGSVGVLEVAEAVAMAPPRRSVIFILYAAEEVGLVGSRYFLQNCPVPVEKIMANINLDMIGRTDRACKETRSHYVHGADDTAAKLKDLVARVNKKTVNWPLVFPKRFISGSDHSSYSRKGIPAVFFFSGMHKDLHRPTDDAELIEFDKMQAISKLTYEVVMELGNQ